MPTSSIFIESMCYTLFEQIGANEHACTLVRVSTHMYNCNTPSSVYVFGKNAIICKYKHARHKLGVVSAQEELFKRFLILIIESFGCKISQSLLYVDFYVLCISMLRI